MNRAVPPGRPGLRRAARALAGAALALLGAAAPAAPAAPPTGCPGGCVPRIGIVSAFGAEADLLLARLQHARTWTFTGRRYTTGVLEGHRVVVVLSGVSLVNATLTTEQLLNHFRIDRLVMSGIAGGVNPAYHVGDVTVPDRWALPLETFWSDSDTPPAPCGPPGDLSCLGLTLAAPEGQPLPPFQHQFPRATHLLHAGNAPQGEYRFDHPVDAAMLATVRQLQPRLQRCGPKARQADGRVDEALCVKEPPQLRVGGRGVSGPVFLADAGYRDYLFKHLQAQAFEMETAALAHVAAAHQVPYIAFRSLSDLAGAEGFNADVGALFTSGLAETNAAEVTLAFLRAWPGRATAVAPARR